MAHAGRLTFTLEQMRSNKKNVNSHHLARELGLRSLARG